MRKRRVPLMLLWATLLTFAAEAQEINARVTVLFNQVSTTVDRRVFQTLQAGLVNFINKRKWTTDVFDVSEKIECSFLINLTNLEGTNVFRATLTVQAGRPVYNTSYLTPLINFQDNDFVFRYVEFQPLEFNETRVMGTEPLAANLTAVLAFYVYMILGLDYDSFAPRGGDPYFQRAINIVNQAPNGRGIAGWTAFDGLRNRYWLAENFMNSRYSLVHDAYYTYYRLAMDRMFDNEREARTQVINALSQLNTVHAENPNIMVIPFFFMGKADEIIRIFQKADPQEKQRALELLQRLDITNASRYKQEIK